MEKSITHKYELKNIGNPHVGLDNIKSFLNELNYKFDLTKDNNAYFIKI